MTAQQTHQTMIDNRQAADDIRLIKAANNVLQSDVYPKEILDMIRDERDTRQARVDRYIAQHGTSQLAY